MLDINSETDIIIGLSKRGDGEKMFCTGCGNKLPDSAVKCDVCGKAAVNINAPRKPAPGPAPQPPGAPTPAPVYRQGPPPLQTRQAPAPPGPAAKKPEPPAPAPAPISNGPEPDPVFSPVKQIQGLNIARAFTHITEDPDWFRKCGIVFLCSIVPILNFFSFGYYVNVLRNSSKGLDVPMPEINIKEQWMSGAKYFLAFFLLGLMALPVFMALMFFSTLPVINIFAYLFLIVGWLAFFVYFVGAGTLAAMEGNPWVVMRFQQCFIAIQNSLVEVVTVALVQMAIYVVVSVLFFLLPLYFVCGGHLAGQLGRVMRTHTRF